MPGICLHAMKKIIKTLSRNIRNPVRVLKPRPLEDEAWVTPT
jgi:hypothetical protein